MYHAHFGLTKPLFEPGIAQEAGVYLGARQVAAVARTKTALAPFGSALLMQGPAGVGKTTLASAAVRAASTRLALGWLTSPPAHATELLEMLLAEFGLSAHRATRAERLQMWRQFLHEMSATESRVIVLVEHCEDHSTDALRALESLTAPDPNGGLGANLVLLGGSDLGAHLKSPALAALRQRIRLRQRVEPLEAAELDGYLAHHAALAGGSVDALFEPSAVAALLEHSGGLPRLVNNLCETALELAAAAAYQRIDGSLLHKVAIELFGLEPAPSMATIATVYSVAAVQPLTLAQPALVGHSLRMPEPVLVAPVAAAPAFVTPLVATPSVAAAPQLGPAAGVGSAPPAAPPPSSAQAPSAAQPLTTVRAEHVAQRQEPRPPPPPLASRPKPPPVQRPPVEPSTERLDDVTDVQDDVANIILAGDDSFATTTIVDEPEVPMADFPVLTDAVAGTGRLASIAPAAPAPAAKRTASAAELDLVSAALAATAWTEDDAPPVARVAPAAPAAVAAPPPAVDDPFDFFDLGSDAPLELIDDTHAAPKAGARS